MAVAWEWPYFGLGKWDLSQWEWDFFYWEWEKISKVGFFIFEYFPRIRTSICGQRYLCTAVCVKPKSLQGMLFCMTQS